MIVGYGISTLNATIAILDGGDTTLQNDTLKNLFTLEDADAFILADVPATANKILDFLAVVVANEVIIFETPTYSAGDVDTQDAWAQTALHVAGSLDVNTTSPLTGVQDLKYNSSSAGITHYRRPVTSSAGGAYTAKWQFKNSANLGATDEVVVAMANSADTDGARAWICAIKGNGDVTITDNAGSTVFTGLSLTTRKALYTVKIESDGRLFFFVDGAFKFQGTVIAGNQTIDRWLVSGSNSSTNVDTGRWDNFTYAAPTALLRRKSILVTPQSSPIDLNGESQLNIQLRTSALATDNVVKTVTLRATDGIVIPGTVQTDGTGFSNEAFYRPSKDAGSHEIIASTNEHTQLVSEGSVEVAINPQPNNEKRQFLETADIKDETITELKIAPQSLSKQTKPSAFWIVKKAYLANTFDTGMPQNANDVVSDGHEHIYINGFDGPAATNPVIRQINKATGSTDGTLAYTTNSLANRRDAIAFNGKHLWLASGINLLKIRASDMNLISTFVIGGGAGVIQYVGWDGESILAFVRGGTLNADLFLHINDSGGIIADQQAKTIVTDIKRVGITPRTLFGKKMIFVAGSTAAGSFVIIDALDHDLKSIAVNTLISGFTGTAVEAAAHDGTGAWIALSPTGGSKEALMKIKMDNFTDTPTLLATIEQEEVGRVYDLHIDGTNIWAITSEAGDPPGDVTRRFLRKLRLTAAGVIEVAQVIDLGEDIEPVGITVDQGYLYIANHAITGLT